MPGDRIRLLALDGGGVRGLSSLIILQQLMATVDPDSPPKPCDYFDMIGGTSTGGIIAIMLGRLRMTVDECINSYVFLSEEVFEKKAHRVKINSQLQGRFDKAALERVVKHTLKNHSFDEDTLLKDSPYVPCKVKQTSGTVCLTSYRSPRGSTDLLDSTKIWQACRATSAATSFFDPITIGPFGEEFVDGAFGANNPIYTLWNQAQDVWGADLQNKLSCLVSIGTGVPGLKPVHDDALKIWSTLKRLATETETTAEQFRRDKSSFGNEGRYFRFNVDRGLEGIGLEESKKIKEIAAATRLYIESQAVFQQMKACANNLAERGFYDLHILADKNPEGQGIDIVAIHGLNGHYENTWTTKRKDGTPVNWLRDLLPEKVRNARIMSFSYSSGDQFSKYTFDVFAFADQLLERILDAQTTHGERARPIVFICHSLGGIIFKQALKKAHENDRYSSTILPRFVGVAFFGTPHRCSSLAHWGEMLSSVLEAGGLATSAKSQLMKHLEHGSRLLENISKSFIDHGEKLKIFSFYETEKMDLMNCKVVETESATLGWRNETRTGINGNHRSMVRFTGEDEGRFKPVWVCISKMVSQAISFEWQELFWTPGQILSNLRTSDYTAHKERNPTALTQDAENSTEDPQARPTICFIDGLDECEENTRKQLIYFISTYFTMPIEEEKRRKGRQKKLKLLVTSRPDNAITNAFDRQKGVLKTADNDQPERRAVRKPFFTMMRLRGEDETEAISNDIMLVIKDAMEELDYLGLPLGLLEGVEGELISRADRTFLWATLIIQLLRQKFEEGVSRSDLDAILRSKSVYAIYAVLLDSNTNHPKARKMLSIILAALEPLTVEELSIALAVRPDHQTFQQSNKPRRPSTRTFNHVERELAYPFENRIKGLCGHFVRIIHQKVYLIHQTAREFLLDQDSLREFDQSITMDGTGEDMMWRFDEDIMEDLSDSYSQGHFTGDTNRAVEGPGSAWQHTFSLIDAHAVLLEICVTYLYLLGKRSGTLGSVIGKPSPKTSAFLNLCHPRFPGFQTWLNASGIKVTELAGSDDWMQDHLVQMLGLEPADREFRREALDLDIARGGLLNNNQLRVLSSNPATSDSSYFPVKADNTGFVSLDIGQARKIFGAKE
ncbi:hypothetical protein DL768_006221 [Monosporascus sp. mg162]|nr:hypothetical protein DL768_006221 [Monosporascus sp. mg162]